MRVQVAGSSSPGRGDAASEGSLPPGTAAEHVRRSVFLTFYFEIVIDPPAVVGKIQTSQRWHLVASVTSWTSAGVLARAEVTTSVLCTFLLPPHYGDTGLLSPPPRPESQCTVTAGH